MTNSLNITLIGQGRMSETVRELALERGHRIVRALGRDDNPMESGFHGEWVERTDVLIDFSTASAVATNVANAVAAGLPIVEGTTGWQDRRGEVAEIVRRGEGCCLHSSNFSLGVQALFCLVRRAGELFAGLPEYAAFIEERHHDRKKDAPSGTALSLRGILTEAGLASVPVSSTRAGSFPGVHTVGFDSPADTLTLCHTARNRTGFASGALFAAGWVVGKRGFYELQEVLFP